MTRKQITASILVAALIVIVPLTVSAKDKKKWGPGKGRT